MAKTTFHTSALVTLLVCILIFATPSNLFLKFGENQAYVRGLLVDYLLPKFYLSDIPILLLIGLSLPAWWRSRLQLVKVVKNKPVILLGLALVITLGIRQIFSPYPLASIWYFFKLLEMTALACSLLNWRKQINFFWVWLSLVVTVTFQSLVGLIQFVTQHSVSNYALLGETNLKFVSGVAKASFNGAEKILPYGTTAHPNVLAGFLVVALLLIWKLRPKVSLLMLGGLDIITGLAVISLYLTQSVTAWLALAIGLILSLRNVSRRLNNQKLLAFIIFLTLILTPIGLQLLVGYTDSNPSILRRQILNQAAGQTFLTNPVWGSGLNTSAAVGEKIVANQEAIRFVQPAHNLLFLWTSETGIIGLALMGLILIIIKHTKSIFSPAWLILLPIAALDHYLLTLQTGLLLISLWLIFSQRGHH